jgi:hypothetical protein
MVMSILENARRAIIAQGDGDATLLSTFVPVDIGHVTLDSLQTILNAIRSSSLRNKRRDLLSHHERRILAGHDETITNVRQTIRQLMDVLLLGAVSGSPPVSIPGEDMQIVTVREDPNRIGLPEGGGKIVTVVTGVNALEPAYPVSSPGAVTFA